MPDLTPQVAAVKPRTRAAWYWLALAPIALGAAIAAVVGFRLYGNIQDMQRVVVPGERVMTLEAGSYVGYLEGRAWSMA